MVYMEIRYGIPGEYLCCTFGARVLHFYWHYYSEVFTVAFLSEVWIELRVKSCLFP